MNIVSIVVPLGGFALAIWWMIKQGEKAKQEYRRRRKTEAPKDIRLGTAIQTYDQTLAGSLPSMGGLGHSGTSSGRSLN